jgi:hypothetical protein
MSDIQDADDLSEYVPRCTVTVAPLSPSAMKKLPIHEDHK